MDKILYARIQSPIKTPEEWEKWQQKDSNKFIDGERILEDHGDYLLEKVAIKVKDGVQLRILGGLLIPGEEQNSIQQAGTGSIANGPYSTALGYNTSANTMGYVYSAIDTKNKKIYLRKTKYTTDELENAKPNIENNNGDGLIKFTTEGWNDKTVTELGLIDESFEKIGYSTTDIFSLVTPSTHLDLVGKIKNIQNNVITYEDVTYTTALSSLTWITGFCTNGVTTTEAIDDGYDAYSFFVPAKPNIGVVSVSQHGVAFSRQSKAVGGYSFACGRENISAGDGAATFGRQNQAAYNSFAAGHNNKALGDRCFAAGTSNSVYAYAGFVAGHTNTVQEAATHSAVFGRNNYATVPNQLIAGQYAKNINALFVIGNGTDGNNRNNAFTVFKDGRATVGAIPVNDMDVATKKYVDDKTTSIYAYKGTKPNYSNLPTTNKIGDVWNVENECTINGKYYAPGTNFAWNGSSWDAQGGELTKITKRIAVLEELPLKVGTNPSSIQSIGASAESAHAFAIGENAKAQGANSFAQGTNTTTTGQWCVALNHGTIAQGRDQMAVGRYNKALPAPTSYTDKTNGAIFMVGNGYEDSFNDDGSVKTENRSNAFVSWNDGRATIGKDPVENMDVATKQYVDALESKVKALESQLQGLAAILNQLNDGGIE